MFDLSNISFGKNLVWFFGVVENRMDPNFLGRVQVRCVGHHTSNRYDLPTEDLPMRKSHSTLKKRATTPRSGTWNLEDLRFKEGQTISWPKTTPFRPKTKS